MSIPAATNPPIRSGLAVAGPSVHTIFARRGDATVDVELVMTAPCVSRFDRAGFGGPLVEVDLKADTCR
jgi:hypothetical protein